MRPAQHFRKLQEVAVSRLTRLRRVADESLAAYPATEAKWGVAFATIEVVNTWAEFTRSYFLSCILRPLRVGGGVVTAPLFGGATANDAIGVVMGRHRPYTKAPASGIWPRRDEPRWHDPHILLTSCADIGCSNLAEIQAALSIPTRAFIDLPVFRNFFAHRNQATASAARNLAAYYGIPGLQHPTDILRRVPIGRPEPLLVDWIDDIAIITEFLCE